MNHAESIGNLASKLRFGPAVTQLLRNRSLAGLTCADDSNAAIEYSESVKAIERQGI